MQKTLTQLISLQEVDAERREVAAALAGLPEQEALAKTQLQESEAFVRGLREKLEALELAQRQAEAQIREKEALITKLEGQQSLVKSNDAYRALLQEVEQAKVVISEQENQALESLESIDQEKAALADAEKKHAELLEKLAQEAESRAVNSDALRQQSELLEQRRQERLSALEDPGALQRYERVCARHWPVLARLEGGHCQVCRVGIPQQLKMQVLADKGLLSCPSCQRIFVGVAE